MRLKRKPRSRSSLKVAASTEGRPLITKKKADRRQTVVIKNNVSPDARGRRPFHYHLHRQSSSPHLALPSTDDTTADLTDADERVVAVYRRYLYYSKLWQDLNPTSQTLVIPDHVLPERLFQPLFHIKSDDQAKQRSLITIFAIWNTMMGTSLLGMPWAVGQAGIIGGPLCILVVALISVYTALRIISLQDYAGISGGVMEFNALVREIMGHRVYEWIAVVFSLATLLGAAVVYWVLLANFLFHSIEFIYEKSVNIPMPPMNNSYSYDDVVCPSMEPANISDPTGIPDDANSTAVIDYNRAFNYFWNLEYTAPITLGLMLFPLINFKSPTFFTKFNALGTISVLIMLTFVVAKTLTWGIHIDITDPTSEAYVPLFRWNFPKFTGVLSLAMFIHNCIISIIRSNKDQKNNVRDLSAGFLLVALTYGTIGILFYLAWPMQKFCIRDNLLNNFVREDLWSTIARFALLFQMFTVFPLICFVFRNQVFIFTLGNAYPGRIHVIALNMVLTIICILVAIYIPHIGAIIRFTGAFCGLVYIFTLPCIAYMKAQHTRGELTVFSVIIHSVIMILGTANFIAQFLF